MPQTTKGFPYPGGGEKMADTDVAIHALATFLDLNNGRIKWGISTLQIITIDVLANQRITFPVAYPAGVSAPVVITQLRSASGTKTRFMHTANEDRFGFDVYGINTFDSVDMQYAWLAIT